jgi:nitroimidazol reductase NimA-like FMN-containing flavoprotein (pyridoxamine 5'-phosphate oxidase superfamily)
MGMDTPVVDIPQHVLAYLASQPTLTLATATSRGLPRATTLTYVNDGPSVYVWTRPDSTTARQIEGNPMVGFAIDQYSEDWSETRGIQGTGEARVLLNPDEITRVVDLFETKYPPLKGTLGSGVSLFRITPTELQYIDAASAGEGAGGASYSRDSVFSVFRDLPAEEIENVATKLQTMQVDAGDVIVRQGAPADKFFIIVEGEVEVVHDQDGEARRVATLSDGQFFGEMAILRDTPRSATVRATSPTTIFAMERDAFRSLVAQSLGTTEDFDRVIQQRLAEIQGD